MGTPETRLRQRFLNNLGLHTCCTDIILHYVSVSNQLQQWTNFCTNFSPKSGGVGTRPLSKKVGGRRPPRPRPTTPLFLNCGFIWIATRVKVYCKRILNIHDNFTVLLMLDIFFVTPFMMHLKNVCVCVCHSYIEAARWIQLVFGMEASFDRTLILSK